MHNCRIYREDQLQRFNPDQPFSTAGGYADLFRAYHDEDGELALKRPRWGSGDSTDRFAHATQEACVWQVLRHPNVLAFLGILYSESHIYLVSSFASHGSLPQYLVAHPNADRTAFVIHITAGLAYLHSQNVIHGDVKGANVLVSQQLTAQLCDFGLSKFDDTPTSNGVKGGSLPWLSPERMDRANPPRTRESDVYAFGMTIYEILSGRIPFHNLAVDELIIAVCIRNERPSLTPEVSTTGTSYMLLWQLARNCWHQDPGRRLSMNQAHDRIAPYNAVASTNIGGEGLLALSGPPSSLSPTSRKRKRIDSVPGAITNTTGAGDMQFGGAILRTTEPTQNEGSRRVVKRPKVSGPSDRSFYGPLSADEQPRETAGNMRITAMDGTEIALRVLSETKVSTHPTAGSIVRRMASSSLVIIGAFKNAKENKEQAMELGRRISTLIQCAARFLERPDGVKEADSEEGRGNGMERTIDERTIAQLESFSGTLQVLERTLAGFDEQPPLQRGTAHKYNQEDVNKWDAIIEHAFSALQVQLSLYSLRLVTNLNDAGARLECDRLLSLLGDGDIGATDKASSAADLMCLPGTRTTVLDQVDKWIADPSGSRIYWISGVAGCGKSALAATIAGRPRAVPTSIATFYFARGNQERNKRVLCSLSRQLAQIGHGSLERFVLNAVKAEPDIGTSHLDTQFQHLLVDPLRKLVPGSPPVILVVDALDEWNNYAAVIKLIELIREAHTDLPPTVRFVLASRNEPHIVKSFESYLMRSLFTRYPLDAVLKSDAGRDIRRYIDERFATLCAHSGPDIRDWPKARDVETLVMLSDGLFQWAATVMSYIGARRSQGRLREILQNPERYRGLDNLYQGVLDASSQDAMSQQAPRLLQNVLGAILTASTPINATVISYLCCDELDTLDETMELIQEEVLPCLASMFIIPGDPTRPITVSHKSVLDYLTNQDRCTDQRFYTNLFIHQERIVHSSFRLMGSKLRRDICGINNPSKLNKDVEDQVTAHISPGLRYHCEHWVELLTTLDQGRSAASRDRLEQFSRTHLLHWLEVMGLVGLTERVIPIAKDVKRWLSAFPSFSLSDEFTWELWSDTQRFVAMFSDVISTAVAHIYISAFRLTPTGTELVRQFSGATERGVRVQGGLLGDQWPLSAWTAVGHTGPIHCASFSPDGKTILSGSSDRTMRIWDAETGTRKGDALKGHTAGVWRAFFSPDGKTILSGSSDNTLRLWDARSCAQKGDALEGHTGWVLCASFSPDGKTILSGSSDKTLRLWDAESGVRKGEALEGHKGTVGCASYSPDGKTIVSGSSDRTMRLWDAQSGAYKGGPLEGHHGWVLSASFSPDGKTILSGSSDKTMRLWDAETGTQKGNTLEGHTDAVWRASFSPDGKTILSVSKDNTIRLWDADSATQKGGALAGHTERVLWASFSPDGKTILSRSGDNTLRLWNTDLGALKVEPRNGHTSGVSCFVFSPDGGMVVSGSYDKSVRLWDTETGALKAKPLSSDGAVAELSFSNDGFTLKAKTYDGLSHEWDLRKYIRTKSNLMRRKSVIKGSVSPEGWIFHRGIRWFWMPFTYADWLLCGSRLALSRERVVYIIDVSEIMHIVE